MMSFIGRTSSTAWFKRTRRFGKAVLEMGLRFWQYSSVRRNQFFRLGKVRLRWLRRVLFPFRVVRVGIVFSLLAAAGLSYPEQSAEILRVMIDDAGMSLVIFALATPFAALAIWSWSQRLLTLLAPKLQRSQRVAGWVARHLPIVLGVLPAVVASFVLAMIVGGSGRGAASRWTLYVGIAAVTGLIVTVILRLRRQQATQELTAKATAIVSIGLVLLFCSFPSWISTWLGAASIFMMWIGAIMITTSALAIVAFRHKIPLFAVLVLLAVAFSYFDLNDNHIISHEVRTPEYYSGSHINDTKFKAWLEARTDRDKFDRYPFFIVSAEGGGIRAAYFTALVLSAIQDRCPAFAQHIFAISGVSGGSIGAAVFSALAKRMPQKDRDSCPVGLDASGKFQKSSDSILGKDFLAPVLAAMLFPDLIQRFLPLPIQRFDRARALERTLERAWHAETGGTEFSDSFFALWKEQWRAPNPALVLNTTSVETGKRMVVAHFNIKHEDISPVETLWDVNAAISPPLSAAAVLSARFPLVTPAGSIFTTGGTNETREKRRYVDGGYFENTGTATVLDLVYGIRWPALKASTKAELHVIRIGTEEALPQYGSGMLSEIMSPIIALLNTREARGTVAKAQIYQTIWGLQGASQGARAFGLFDFDLKKRQVPLPLGWVLSKSAMAEMAAQISTAGLAERIGDSAYWNCNGEDNYCEMQRILDVLRGRGP